MTGQVITIITITITITIIIIIIIIISSSRSSSGSSFPREAVPAEDLIDDGLVADDVAGALDGDAGVDLDLDGSRPAVLVDHGNAALTGAALLDGLDDGPGDGVGVACGRVGEADEVVVLGDENGGIDAEADGRDALCRRVHVVVVVVAAVAIRRCVLEHGRDESRTAHDDGVSDLLLLEQREVASGA